MLTTVDNPYDPRTQYDLWLDWDHDNMYFTQEYLARLLNLSPDLDEYEVEQLIDETIEEILELDVLGIYKKI
ncbi:TPA: hypothetical protein SIF56_004461 [Escherichia coli]|nr:hypothetical protein [Escherichia coli]